MLRTLTAVTGLFFASATFAYAAGECSKQYPNNARKRDACIEDKIDKLAVSAPTTQSVQAAIKDALTGVKIDWSKHHGVYLWFSDWTQKPERPAWSVNSDNPENNTFDIHK